MKQKHIFYTAVAVLIFLGLFRAVSGASIFQPFQGGTGTASVPNYGEVLIGTSDGKYTPVATSTLGITGAAGAAGGNDFTYNTDIGFGLTGSATGTKTHFTAGIHASGTSQLGTASSTMQTIADALWLPFHTSALLLSDTLGKIAEYTGTTCTNQFVRALSALGVATCESVNLASDVTGTLDISASTNLAATYPLVLTGDTLSTPLATTTLKQTYGTNQSGELSLATSSDTNLGLNITNTNGAFTFTPSWIGTLANARLTNSSVSYGGVAVSLGASDATPAFNLADATGLPLTTGITGTLGVANGGTGQTSFGQGWLNSDGTTVTSSTSPTVNYITATSTTATSTFIGPTRTQGLVQFADQEVVKLTSSTRVQFEDSDGSNSDWAFRVASPGWGALNFGAGNGTLAVPTSVSSNRALGQIDFFGHDGSTYTSRAKIVGYGNGRIAISPGYLEVSTTTATSTFANALGIGTTTASQVYAMFTAKAKSTTLDIAHFFNSVGTKILALTEAGATALGVWDFGGADSVEIPNGTAPTVDATGETAVDTTSDQFVFFGGTAKKVLGNGNFYPAFTYATSTAFTGTTTIPLGTAFVAETWNAVQCFTDVGTVNVSFYDGTNRMDLFNASTTVGTVTLSTNNTFTASEKRYVDIGTPASNPTKVSCTVSKSLTAD